MTVNKIIHKNAVIDADANNTVLREKLNLAELAVKKLQNELNNDKNSITTFQMQISMLNEDIDALILDKSYLVAKYKDEAQNLQKHVDDLNTALKGEENKSKSLQENVGVANKQLENLRDQHKQHIQEQKSKHLEELQKQATKLRETKENMKNMFWQLRPRGAT